ncbi:hypothetical protein ACFTXJ_00210 [Streptomyces zhihengii]
MLPAIWPEMLPGILEHDEVGAGWAATSRVTAWTRLTAVGQPPT